MTSKEIGRLEPTLRSFHWLFVWAVIVSIWSIGVIKRGATYEIWFVLALATFVFLYLFLIDFSHRIWWTADQIWCRGWDYLAIKPMLHTVRVSELCEVKTANHPGNFAPNKPFDRFLLVSSADTITILPSFHRREELEELLRLIREKRPDAFTDPQVLVFLDGGFAEWWRYR